MWVSCLGSETGIVSLCGSPWSRESQQPFCEKSKFIHNPPPTPSLNSQRPLRSRLALCDWLKSCVCFYHWFSRLKAINRTSGPAGSILIYSQPQPSLQAFLARSFLDSTMSCDVTERYSSALSQTLRGEQIKRERLGTRLSQPKSRVLYATRMRVSSHSRRSLFRWTFYRKISRIPNNVQITQQQQCRNSRDVKHVHREP